MSVSSFKDLKHHVGHEVEVVTYGDPPVNVAIECLDCNEVLLDFDREEDDDDDIKAYVLDRDTNGQSEGVYMIDERPCFVHQPNVSKDREFVDEEHLNK